MTPEKRFADKFCKSFEKAGWTIINMESLGDGVPDRLIAKMGWVFFLEFKIGTNGLTPHQKVWKNKHDYNAALYLVRQGEFKITDWLKFFEDKIKCV